MNVQDRSYNFVRVGFGGGRQHRHKAESERERDQDQETEPERQGLFTVQYSTYSGNIYPVYKVNNLLVIHYRTAEIRAVLSSLVTYALSCCILRSVQSLTQPA